MCYVIEIVNKYTSFDYAISIQIRKHENSGLENVKVMMTSDHDYLGATHMKVERYRPFTFIVPFNNRGEYFCQHLKLIL